MTRGPAFRGRTPKAEAGAKCMCTPPRGNLTSLISTTGTGHGVDALGNLYIPLPSYTAPKLPKLSRAISMSACLTAERAVRGSLLSVVLTHLSSQLLGAIAADGSVQLRRVAFSIKSSVPVDAFHNPAQEGPNQERDKNRTPAIALSSRFGNPNAGRSRAALRDALQITYS